MLLLTPLTAFYLMQFVFGGLAVGILPRVLLGNYLCIGAGFFLLSAVTGRILLSSLFIHLLCLGWGAANYFVNLYRGLPILPWDFTALNTALAVADSYDLYLTGQMIASLAAILSLGLLIRRQVKALGGGGRPGRRTRLLCLTAALICCIPVIRVNTLGRFGIQTDVWDQAGSYRSGRAAGGVSAELSVPLGGGAGGLFPRTSGGDPGPAWTPSPSRTAPRNGRTSSPS